MKSKKKHTNLDFEVVDGIGKYMDDDIQRIIEGKQLELGDRELPPFDEYRIYKNIQEAVMREEKRKNRRIRMTLFFKWTVACAIVLLVIGVGYNFYQSHSEANLVYREVCAVRGEKLLVLLPDGSRVDVYKRQVPNFGGKNTMTGDLDMYASSSVKALRAANKGNLIGFGSAPEGLENNEVVYELLADMGWSSEMCIRDRRRNP